MFSAQNDSQKPASQPIRIGHFHVNFTSREIEESSTFQRITPKSSQVLRLLCQHAGTVVTHQQFLDAVWPDTFRSPDIVAHAIRELRKAFGDVASKPEYIETIPKVGYRLIAEVQIERSTPRSSVRKVVSSIIQKAKPTALAPGLIALFIFTIFSTAFFLNISFYDTASAETYQSIPLTRNNNHETLPAFSPSGDNIIYSARLADSRQFDLYIKNFKTGIISQLTETPHVNEYAAAWSPDNTQVAYLAFEDGVCSVEVLSLVSEMTQRLSACANARVTSLDWSADGSKLAFSYAYEGGPGNVGLFYYDFERAELRSFNIAMISTYNDHSPRFSKNGKSLAFLRSSASETNLYFMSLESSEATRQVQKLTHFNGHISGLDWLGGDHQLIFSAPTPLGRKLHGLNIETLKLRQLSDHDTRLLKGQPNSLNIVYVDHQLSSSLLELDFSVKDAPNTRRHFASPYNNHSPAISRNGDQVLFLSTHSGYDELRLGNLQTSSNRKITSDKAKRISHPRWSSNGEQFLYLETPAQHPLKEKTSLVLVNATSLVKQRITHLGNVKFADYSHDDTRIYFATEQNYKWKNYSLDPKTGEVLLISTRGGVNPTDPLGDGYIYYTKSGIAGLWRRKTKGGKEEKIVDAIGFWNRNAWAINRKGIYFAGDCTNNNTRSVCHVDWLGSPTRSLAQLDPKLVITGLTLAPGSNTVLLSAYENSASNIVMLSRN